MALFHPTDARPLPRPLAGWFNVSQRVTQRGELACFQATTDVLAANRRNQERLGAHDPWTSETPRQERLFGRGDRGRLLTFGADRLGSVAEFELEAAFPRFDQLPDGGWVIADGRCQIGFKNGAKLAEDGAVLAEFHLGDGIEHLQCGEAGDIWVGYFDEGVFGAQVYSREGLARFDREGRFAWGYHSQVGGPPIDDCYALNVIGREAWSSFYSDFPILRVAADGAWKTWPNGVRGAKALAVEGRDLILFGGYEGDAKRIAHVRVGDKYCEWLGVLELATEEAARSFTAFGRGDRIHLVGPAGWRSFSVADVLAAMAEAGPAAIPDYDSLDGA